jgi:hypothetical protein
VADLERSVIVVDIDELVFVFSAGIQGLSTICVGTTHCSGDVPLGLSAGLSSRLSEKQRVRRQT